MRSTIGSAIGLMLALNVPATIGLIALANPIVALIFEHGRFTAEDTEATAVALRFYAIGLVGYSVVGSSRRRSTRCTAAASRSSPASASVIANILLNLVLVRVMGYAGLALGTSLAAIVNASIQFLLLRRALDGLQGRHITVTFLKATVASLAMAAAAWLVERWLHDAMPGADTWIKAVRVGLAIGVALGVLAVSATLLRLREFEESRDMVMKRLGRLKP